MSEHEYSAYLMTKMMQFKNESTKVQELAIKVQEKISLFNNISNELIALDMALAIQDESNIRVAFEVFDEVLQMITDILNDVEQKQKYMMDYIKTAKEDKNYSLENALEVMHEVNESFMTSYYKILSIEF